MRGELLQIGRRLGAGMMDPVHIVVSVRVRIVSGQCPDVSGCIHIRIVSGYWVSLHFVHVQLSWIPSYCCMHCVVTVRVSGYTPKHPHTDPLLGAPEYPDAAMG